MEYGIAIDESALRDMLEADVRRRGVDLSAWSTLGITVLDWVNSPSDNADAVKETLLDDGESPQAAMQSLADRVETWKREGRGVNGGQPRS